MSVDGFFMSGVPAVFSDVPSELLFQLFAAGADVGALDREYRGTPAQFARVAVDVTNNPKCAAVAEYLESLSTDGAGRQQG